jgi:aldehyde:ferredoxin oxidoreductase
MRKYYDINLNDRTVTPRELHGEEIVMAGRYLIAKTLVEMGAARVDPLAPENPLIFSAGRSQGRPSPTPTAPASAAKAR